MRRPSRKKSARTKTEPTADQLQKYIAAMHMDHALQFGHELHSAAPHWEYLLALHVRMTELEHLAPGVEELL